MPVHILPARKPSSNLLPVPAAGGGGGVSRRGFLGTMAVAGLASRSVLAGLRVEDEAKDAWFAMLSDVHIAADAKAVNRGQVMAENLRTVVAGILAEPTKPLGAFIDGDLALQDGQCGDYETLVGLLKPLTDAGIPLHLALGNHDDREHFRTVLKVEAPGDASLASKHLSVVPGCGHRFIVLDSLERTAYTPGTLGPDQRAWLARVLEAEPRTPVIVLVHHNLVPGGNGLTDTNELLELLRPRRQVKAVFYGHTHVWKIKQGDEDLHEVNLPAVAYPFANQEPLGWCRLTLAESGAKLELRATGGDKSADRQLVELAWRTA